MLNVNATRGVMAVTAALWLAGCPTHTVVNPPPQEGADLAPRAALQAFLDDQQQGAFDKAYALLAAPLRARYTPERLKQDYVRDHDLADDKLSRIRAALASGAPMQVSGAQALLPLGPDRAVHLVAEGEGGLWRVASLE